MVGKLFEDWVFKDWAVEKVTVFNYSLCVGSTTVKFQFFLSLTHTFSKIIALSGCVTELGLGFPSLILLRWRWRRKSSSIFSLWNFLICLIWSYKSLCSHSLSLILNLICHVAPNNKLWEWKTSHARQTRVAARSPTRRFGYVFKAIGIWGRRATFVLRDVLVCWKYNSVRFCVLNFLSIKRNFARFFFLV